MNSRVTISHIAQTLGVSNATVHRALYEKPGVSPAVASEIRRLARELGYCPDRISSSLRKKPLNLVIAFPEAVQDNRFFYSQLWKGARNYLKELGAYHLNLIEAPYGEGNGFTQVMRRILSDTHGQIDGILTGGRIFKEGFVLLRRVLEQGIPVVLVSEQDPEGSYLCSIRSDGTVDGMLAAEILYSQTRPGDKILVCAGDSLLYSNRSSMEGFEQYLWAKHQDREVIKLYGYAGIDGIEEQIRALLTSDSSIQALYSVNLRCSLLLAKITEELGLTGHIALTGSDLCPESACYMQKGVITSIIYRDPTMQGYLGARRLTDLVIHQKPPPTSVEYIPSSLILKSNLEQYL